MSEVEVVRFGVNDVAFGKALTDLEKWHRTTADWNRLLRIEPSGMLKARVRGQDVGIAGVLSYDGVSWIHSVIVLPEFRRMGIGRALMNACIAKAVERGNQCVKLDAVPTFEDFYRGLGFLREFESRRYVGDWQSFPITAERIRPEDIDNIIALDRSVVGSDRSRVIRTVYEDYPHLAFHVSNRKGVAGYVLAREGEERVQIGPCLAANSDFLIARKLITTLIGSCKNTEKFRMCVPGENAQAVKLAESLDFVNTAPSTRMYLGTPLKESPSAFAMISAEKG